MENHAHSSQGALVMNPSYATVEEFVSAGQDKASPVGLEQSPPPPPPPMKAKRAYKRRATTQPTRTCKTSQTSSTGQHQDLMKLFWHRMRKEAEIQMDMCLDDLELKVTKK
jgi:hypothetical protein